MFMNKNLSPGACSPEWHCLDSDWIAPEQLRVQIKARRVPESAAIQELYCHYNKSTGQLILCQPQMGVFIFQTSHIFIKNK